jgi:hypothetical protein
MPFDMSHDSSIGETFLCYGYYHGTVYDPAFGSQPQKIAAIT